MSVKVKEAFCFDSFMDRLLYFDDFHGDQLQDEWRSGGDGSAVVIGQQTGGIVRLTSGAVDGNFHYIDWNDIRSLRVDQKVTMETRISLGSTLDIGPEIAIRFDLSNRIIFYVVDLTWWIRCTDEGASTSMDTGIVIDTDYKIFRIECFPTDEVHFYIDGVETANSPITTNIPDDVDDYLQPYLLMLTKTDENKTMDIDYVYIRQER